MGGSLLNAAGDLFRGAASSETELTAQEYARIEGENKRRSESNTELFKSGMNNANAQKLQAMSDDAAMARQKEGQDAASKRQDADNFVTITPQIKKGAHNVTGDESWNEIPDGTKMRADVYSSLITAGTKMNEENKPRILDIVENDQVYTAEYDPKTRNLRKLTAGGEKFDPNKKNNKGGGSGGPGSLNPFTLQNVIRQDEKTLLQLLGGKGRKGIPSEGIIPGYDDKEKSKLGTIRSLSIRLRNNYTNLQTIEKEKGLNPTQIDPEILSIIDELGAEDKGNKESKDQKEGGVSGTMVRVKNKAGVVGFVPKNKLPEKLKAGYTLVNK